MSLQENREIYAANRLAVKAVLNQADFKQVEQGGNGGQHPADLRRSNQTINAALEKIFEAPAKEKRETTETEQKAFEGLCAARAVNDIYINMITESDQHFQSAYGLENTEGKRVYAANEKMALNTRPQNLQGIHLGHIMAGMIGINRTERIQNALSEGTDSAGGYTAPVEILREFVDLLRAKSVMFGAGARTVVIEAKKSNIATVTADPVATWRAENAPVSEADLTLGNVQFNPKSLAVIVRVSRELLQDSINIEEILLNSLAQGLATQVDYAALYGSGASNQPLGLDSQLTTASRVSTLAVNGAKLSASGNFKPILQAAAQVALANDDATAAVMSPRTLYDINILADSTGQPLQQPKEIADMMLLDTTSVPTNLTVGTATGVCSELFVGNFTNMLLGLRQALQIRILNETYATSGQFGFEAHLRADWAVARLNSFWKVRGILAE